MYLRMYLADYLIDELPVIPNLLPCTTHRELYVKAIVASLKKKHQELLATILIEPVFFLEEVPSKMNRGAERDDDFLFADLLINAAIKN